MFTGTYSKEPTLPKKERVNSPVPMDDQLCYAVYSTGIAIQRIYKPLLDELGVTYPQYLVLNVLWRHEEQRVSDIADKLALESSTLTPLLKRLETAGFVHRTRNPQDERQVVVGLTDKGRALRNKAGCLGDALLGASGQSPGQLAELNRQLRELRDAIYSLSGNRNLPA
jgi:DNA-binding MarR family transcriptional regulator